MRECYLLTLIVMKAPIKFFFGVLCCGVAVFVPLLWGLKVWAVLVAGTAFCAGALLMQNDLNTK